MTVLVTAKKAVLVTAEDVTEGVSQGEGGRKQTQTKGFLCLVRNKGSQKGRTGVILAALCA